MSKILIIEDDSDLREGLAFALELEGYETAQVRTLCDARALLEETPWDLLLLDCNLPDGSGFDLVAELHGVCATPMFMLTARNTEMDEVKALELGVADFMSKPFSLAVLKARIRRILAAASPRAILTSAGVRIDKDACSVQCNGEDVPLSRVEYKLLLYLVENHEQVLTKEQILAHVWDAQGKFVDENTLSVTIRRLRAKIERDAKHPLHIRTVHGIGYVWKEGEG